MPGRVTIKVEGAREIAAALRELGATAANRVARSALNRSAAPLVKRAKELVPVDSGLTRRSITKRLRRQQRGSDRQTLIIGVQGPRARLAHLLEFGSVYMAAQPFLRPSLDEKSHEAVQVMADAMKVGIEREINKLRVQHSTRAR